MRTTEETVRRYYDAFNRRDQDAYADLFAHDCLIEAPGLSARGIEAVRAFDRVYTDAFPEARIESLRMTVIGDALATANWMHGGKHQGPLRSPAGEIPPTGASFNVPYCASFIVKNGRIALQRLQFDAEMIPVVLGLR
jgi:ketosteroid isomerase-like protein